jgi:hypothetical protein
LSHCDFVKKGSADESAGFACFYVGQLHFANAPPDKQETTNNRVIDLSCADARHRKGFIIEMYIILKL